MNENSSWRGGSSSQHGQSWRSGDIPLPRDFPPPGLNLLNVSRL